MVMAALEKVSGISVAEQKKIFEGVKQNHAKLAVCAGPHDFLQKENGRLIPDYECSKCGGIIGSQQYHWYMKGLEHGRL